MHSKSWVFMSTKVDYEILIRDCVSVDHFESAFKTVSRISLNSSAT